MSACTTSFERTFYPLLYPSSTIFLMSSYSDRTYLSLLYYLTEAEISLSERYLCVSSNSAGSLYSGAVVGNGAVCLTSATRSINTIMAACSSNSLNVLARETVNSQSMLRSQTLALLTSLGLTLDVAAKNYIMSDCTLIKLSRSELTNRDYLIMLTSLQEIGINLSLYASQNSTTTSVVTFATSVVTLLSGLVMRNIDLLNTGGDF